MKKNIIPISLLFGVVIGNAIGTVLLIWNINMGLLIGNIIGISLGLLVGLICNYLHKNKKIH